MNELTLPSICNDVEVIEWETINALCPDETYHFQAALDKYGIDEDDFATCYSKHDLSELVEHLQTWGVTRTAPQHAAAQIADAWKALQRAFSRATRVGSSYLQLGIGYMDEGDERYIPYNSNVYFTVENAYQFTPAAQVLKNKLTRIPNVTRNC